MVDEATAEKPDPSMEDILSSIRRILNEDQADPERGAAPPELMLDETMLAAPEPPPANEKPQAMPEPPALPHAADATPDGLASAETERRVAGMLAAITRERAAALGRAGLTIEDLVREELRPMLRQWLDLHLPGLVERLVREELARIGGAAGV